MRLCPRSRTGPVKCSAPRRFPLSGAAPHGEAGWHALYGRNRPAFDLADRYYATFSTPKAWYLNELICKLVNSSTKSLSLGQDAFAFESFMQQGLDVRLVRQALGCGEFL